MCTIPFVGILDRVTGESLTAEVTEALVHGPVVVDLQGVTVCGISGLRALMTCHRTALRNRSPLVFAAPSSEVRAALAASGVGPHLPMCRSVTQALDAVRQLAAVWSAVGAGGQVTPAA